jgi:RHS repeat-associated protein
MYENNVLKELPIYGPSRLGVYRVQGGSLENDQNKLTLGRREYELANHLAGETVSNVLATVSDAKLPAAKVLSFTDYYAFGGAMPGRSGGANYRYGFNGKENDGDFGNAQLIQDYGFRLYNPAIGKFLSVDPLSSSYPFYTPYQFAGNMPVRATDLDGAEPEFRAGIKVNLSNKGAVVSTYASVQYRAGMAMVAANYSASYHLGELGTAPGANSLFYAAFSPSLTLGTGRSAAVPLNTLAGLSGTGVQNDFKYSATVGQNFISSTGKVDYGASTRDQRTGFYGFRVGQFYFGTSNDTKIVLGDGGDDFWSANVQFGYHLGGGARLEANFDMYYGGSEQGATYEEDWKYTDPRAKRHVKKEILMNYDNQPESEMRFNDATNALQLFLPFGGGEATFGMGWKGRSAMWFSNWMHNKLRDEAGNPFHHLYVPNDTKPYFRLGVNRTTTTQ